MASKNEITGKRLTTSVPSKEYLDNYDRIFRSKQVEFDFETQSDSNSAGQEGQSDSKGSKQLHQNPPNPS